MDRVNSFLYFLVFIFCALCETFAPSAFKKSPLNPLLIPSRKFKPC